jgi:hypothetical protein
MIRLYFTSGLTLISIFCVAQEGFTIRGHLKYCYDKSIGPDNFRNFQVSIVDIEPHYESGEEMHVNESGEFSFKNLRASTYKISTHLFRVSSIIVTVDKDMDDIILCVDYDFRPVPQDTLATFLEKAKKDIAENNLKIYHLSPGLVIQTRNFYRRNRRLKRKFNFQIETISCLMALDRQEFVEQEKYLAYNKVVEEYLDTKYGSSWRSAVQ